MTAATSGAPGEPGAEELIFLPLGGTGEIGMNLNLYGHDGRWLMVDLGITFADTGAPGFEILMADPEFIVERRDRLAGLVLTHAHEDHIGAVPYIWPRLRCPIYATPFTARLVRAKLAEVGWEAQAEIIEVPLSGRFSVGPFEIQLITLTHSIPEPNALVIRTPAGTVLHTGDWKLDPDPVVGETYDEAALRALAEDGVLAMVCDSTNAMVPGVAGSEGTVQANLQRLIGGLENRVAVTCFATNVARLESICRAAAAHGRRVALVGRSMHRIHQAARESGFLADLPPMIDVADVGYLPRREVLLLCTGSQGEPRGAMWRIARNEHPDAALEAGDAVIFSSRVIPGNEVAIHALHNRLVEQGIEVYTDREAPVHVSGHPARDELTQMYQWVRPKIAVPVHGEARHLVAQAEIAETCQVPQVLVGENGAVMRLAPGQAEIVDQVWTGRLVLDGSRLLPSDSEMLRARSRLRYAGAALVTLVLDQKGRALDEPRVTLEGVLDPIAEAGIVDDARAAVSDSLARQPARVRRDDEALAEAIRIALRRHVFKAVGKKPVTRVHLVRLGASPS
ncbi:MAG: ribonuclease J [Kiloniellales bacterium]|nr:ribonuclease J [Kiloniellales bacterium]